MLWNVWLGFNSFDSSSSSSPFFFFLYLLITLSIFLFVKSFFIVMENTPIQIDNRNQTTHEFIDLVSANSSQHVPAHADNQLQSRSSVSSETESGSESESQSESVTDHDQDSVISDCESSSSGANSGQTPAAFNNRLLRLAQGDRAHDVIKYRFLSGLGLLASQTTVVSIHRNTCSGLMGQARVQSFHVYFKALETKCGGNANLKFAWYGCRKDDTYNIIKHGFGPHMMETNGLIGRGMYLSLDSSPLGCVKKLDVDEDGLRHLLLCRVILGKPEVIRPDSEQCHPSSEEYDSGVDDLINPKKYFVWNTNMNTQVLPEYVISFRAPSCLEGFSRTPESIGVPTSPWMPFPVLISALSKLLPPATVGLLAKHYKDHRDRKIPRQELIRRMRQIAGDKLLVAVIKSFSTKA